MGLEVNGARGEVALSIGKHDLVIAATMEGLAAVSTRLECKSLADLFVRLSGTEVAATRAAVAALAVKGDAEEASKALRLKHFGACSAAFAEALAHHFKDDEGNEQTAKVET